MKSSAWHTCPVISNLQERATVKTQLPGSQLYQVYACVGLGSMLTYAAVSAANAVHVRAEKRNACKSYCKAEKEDQTVT